MQSSTLLEPPVPAAPAFSLPWEARLAHVGFQRYCVLAALVAGAGSLALLGLATFINGIVHAFPPLHAGAAKPGFGIVLGNLVLAPVIETALLIVLLKLLARFGLADTLAVALSAVLWGLLHGSDQPLRFFGSVWSFVVFGYSFLLWQRRQPQQGFGAAAWTHALVNLGPTMALLLGS